MIAGWVVSSSLLLFAPSLALPSFPGPVPIVGGTDAATCEWPSTVALRSGGTTYCSGTLIHPEVILTAAHCLHPDNGWGTPTDIAFGEEGATPELVAGVETCALHPQYDHYAELHSPQDAHDLAYCVLSEPVLDVVPTPPLMGCEVDQLDPGDEVRIVGFGANSIEPNGGGVDLGGVGTKRHIPQSLEQIDALDQLYLVGMTGSACSGDSGGSAYFQLDDGSWRVVAAAARIHPDAPVDPPYCTYGVIYTGIWNEMDWFESETGLDLTPCHDPDGTWNPGADCTDFPLEPQGAASWADGCAAQPVSGASVSCAPDPPGGTGDTGDTSDTSDTDPTGETGQDTTAGESTGDGSSGDPTGPPSSTGLPEGTDGGSTGTTPPAEDGDGSGCGCRSTAPGAPGGLALALLLLGWRRRPR
ncbi:MAG: trypsin-like serine protease [Myxococcales bacterium]|nr:trypsin-like serine protease [Myxococcales bacterium]